MISFWCPVIVTVLYAVTALDHLRRGENPYALVWGAYALANVGLIWSMVCQRNT